MSEYLKQVQNESQTSKSVKFANAKYEIENNFITEECRNYLQNIEPDRTYGTNEFRVINSFSYNHSINNSLILFSLTYEEKLKNWLRLNESHNFSDYQGMPISVKEIMKKPDLLKKRFDELMSRKTKEKINFQYPEGWLWVTSFHDIKAHLNNVNDIINKLGLYHYTNIKTPKLYGLVFKVTDLIYKPTFLNLPSDEAYCTKPHSSKNRKNWGATLNMDYLKQDMCEALMPLSYFNQQKVKIRKVVPFESIYSNKVEETTLKREIFDILNFDGNINYRIDNNLNFDI